MTEFLRISDNWNKAEILNPDGSTAWTGNSVQFAAFLRTAVDQLPLLLPETADFANQKHAAELESCIENLRDHDFFGTSEVVREAAAYLQSLTTINPRSKLPQSPEMVHWERDSLLTSTDAMAAEIMRLKAVNRGRLRKLKKLRIGIEAGAVAQEEAEA